MQSHCPTSTFYSIGLLRNHRWFINERGYANVVPSVPGANGIEDVVWGILYTLRSFDEELLDKQEGIPWAYSKEDMDVEVISVAEDGRGTRREIVRALVYIDRERVQESYPWPELVVKMNKGIQDAVERGVPRTWIDRVVGSFLADRPTVNGTEGQVKDDSVPPVHNGTRPTSATRPDSDRASHTQGSVFGEQFVDGVLNNRGSSHSNQAQGLEKSKYAQDGNMGRAHWRKPIQDQDTVAFAKKGASGAQGHGNKALECWWWKVKGCCRFSDEECAYAHYDTGVAAEEPGRRKKAPPYEKTKWSTQLRTVPTRERSQYNTNLDKEKSEHPYGYQQDWSESQGRAEQKNDAWGEQVENLMDSEPEWLVANDREDVKW
jgi:gamma-glutamylcyclotransferase